MKLIEHIEKNEIINDHKLTSEHTLLFHFNDLLYKIDMTFYGCYEDLLANQNKRKEIQILASRTKSKYNTLEVSEEIIQTIKKLKSEIKKEDNEIKNSNFQDLYFREYNVKLQVFSNQIGWIEITKKDIKCDYIKKIRVKNNEGRKIIFKRDFLDKKLSEEVIEEATQYFKKIIPIPKRKKIFASF